VKVATITKIFRFEAAHHLPGHRGKCANPHGHSYRLEITLRGPVKDAPNQSDDGMAMDFSDLTQIVRASVIERLDHQDLNLATGLHTTAENLAIGSGIPWLQLAWMTNSSIEFGSGRQKAVLSKSREQSGSK